MPTRWTIRLAAAALACASLAAQPTGIERALYETLDRLSGPDQLGISADRMLAGSVGKMFVSAVILLAIEDGALHLDDPVERWLGGGITRGHDGWFPGYLTEALYYPERKTDIAIQVNTDDQREMKMPLGKLMEAVSSAVLEKGGAQ